MLSTKEELYLYLEKISRGYALKDLKYFTANHISESLNISRNLASQYLNELVKEERAIKVNSRPVYFFHKKNVEREAQVALETCVFSGMDDFQRKCRSDENKRDFQKAIGYYLSLSSCIEQCKAAVKYPPNGLPALFNGAGGTGKSFLSRLMYEYAVNERVIGTAGAASLPPYITVDCSEYAQNEEKFAISLCGSEDGKGWLAKANGGILFFDEIDRLPFSGQELIYSYLISGQYKGYHDDEHVFESNARLIFSTTKVPAETLYKPLARMIPIVIPVPTLHERTADEKEEMLVSFLKAEGRRMGVDVSISQNAFHCMLEFSYEKAKVENPYTPEAYELCKRLEFKNMLNRFDPATTADSSMELEFFTCNDLSGVEALFEKAAQKDQVGISVLADPDQVYTVGLVLDEKEIYQIPVGGLLTGDYLCGKLKTLADSTVLCAMDIKSVLKHVSLDDPKKVFDAGVAAYLLNPLKSSYSHDDIAKEYLDGMMFPSKEDLLGKTSLKKAWEEELECLGNYACYQAFVPCMARKVLLEKLDETGMRKVYDEIELPLVFTLDSMEKWGISVKGEELKSYGEKLKVRIQELEKTIWQEAGEEFNINSPKQLGVILFEKLGLPGGKKTKTGYSTAADILDKLAPDHAIVKDILEYRQLTKLKSTYADGLGNVIGEDGRIHSTFNQTITATGRISSTDPNLQNIPVRMELGRLIRKVFVPEEGFVFLDADYSQIELRVLAHMSGDEKLIQAYREAEDIHRLTASQVFHVPLDEVTSLQRRNAKAVNFGIVYGISSFGLSQDLSITRKEASAYIEKYFETYPKIKGFLDGLVKDGKEHGYVTTMFGRRRPVPELRSSNFMQRSFGERVAMNSPIQGTAADIIKIAMNHVYERMKKEGLRSRLVLQVHDELLIETKKEEIEEVSRILEEEMKGAADLAVELDVDMHQGDSWYEAK